MQFYFSELQIFGHRNFYDLKSKREHCRVNYDRPFTCYKCGKRYTWTDSLTRHLREGCGVLPKHNCTLCGRKFRRKDYLLRHENNVHK
ncbi:Zinc finger protein 746 [Formica fusca]